ncbi:MAG: hypothetical protein JM58_11605 [Peptococcaceae bacterium BICA1-8]|nr:MAG: hypothetical protein JM58_11605 [Peptococcaceae bacterium BICA1-8]
MKQLYFIGIIGVVTFLYSAINYYIGIRGWQAFGNLMTPYKRLYWIIYWFIVFAFILARLGERFLSGFGSKHLALIGGYWLAAMYYLLIIVILIDIIRLLNRWFKILPGELTGNASFNLYTGLAVVLLISTVLIFGTWSARNPQITHYDITIPKLAPNLNKLHAVMVSDIHLGNIVDKRRLKDMVERINKINPDIVFFAGDIVDENINIFLEQEMTETLKELRPRLGSFAAMGNHEYIGGHAEDIMHHLEDSGIRVLRDNCEKVADSFYIVGRDELMANNFGGNGRKSLETLLKDIDISLPIILLDHQPQNLEEPQKAGIDLQFSGHTHHGQFFPNNYITGRIFEVDWGYLEKGNLQVIVSSGYGTWGPPIRIGSRPELVEVFITFGEK